MIETIFVLLAGPLTLIIGLISSNLIIRILPESHGRKFGWSAFLCAAFSSYALMTIYSFAMDHLLFSDMATAVANSASNLRSAGTYDFAEELANSELRRAFWHKASIPAAVFFAAIAEGMRTVDRATQDVETENA